MIKCKVCGKKADIKCEGKCFCMPHYTEWAEKQNKVVFDWEAVNCE